MKKKVAKKSAKLAVRKCKVRKPCAKKKCCKKVAKKVAAKVPDAPTVEAPVVREPSGYRPVDTSILAPGLMEALSGADVADVSPEPYINDGHEEPAAPEVA